MGNMTFAKQHAVASGNLSNDKYNEAWSGIALALGGDSAQAIHLATDLATRFPADTIVQSEFLPTIRAAVLLRNIEPGKAIEELEKARPYELAALCRTSFPFTSEARHISRRARARAAAGEFQKVLDHPGVVSTIQWEHWRISVSRVPSPCRGRRKGQNRLPGLLRPMERRRS